MPKPEPRVRKADFSTFEAAYPDQPKPGTDLDNEFDESQRAVNAMLAWAATVIADEDTFLQPNVVRPSNLSEETLLMLGSGWLPRGVWAPTTDYAVSDYVIEPSGDGDGYLCVSAHTSSSDFAADVAAGLWTRVLDSGLVASYNATSARFNLDIAGTMLRGRIQADPNDQHLVITGTTSFTDESTSSPANSPLSLKASTLALEAATAAVRAGTTTLGPATGAARAALRSADAAASLQMFSGSLLPDERLGEVDLQPADTFRFQFRNDDETAARKAVLDAGAFLVDGVEVYHPGNPPPTAGSLPVGTITAWPQAAAPTGALLCDGAALNSVTNPEYADLFAVIGTTFGGTGDTDFRVPDIRGRTLFMPGTAAGATKVWAFAETYGLDVVLLTADQSGIREHDHAGGAASEKDHPTGPDTNPGWHGNEKDTSGLVGGPQDALEAHENLPPGFGLPWVIWYAPGAASSLVSGPASAVDRRVAIFSGTSGKLIVDSGYLIDDLLGGTGTLKDVAKDGSVVLAGAAQLDFRDEGDATVDVVDAGGGVARVTITAVGGGSGSGITKGSPFVAGDIMAVASSAGAGSAISVDFAPADVTLLDVAQEFTAAKTMGAGNELIFRQFAGNTRIGHIAAGGNVLAFVGSSDGVTPDLGLNFNALESTFKGGVRFDDPFLLRRSDLSVHGIVGALAAGNGAYFAYSPDGVAYDPNDGAVAIEPGRIDLHGGVVSVPTLKHLSEGGEQVYVSPSGMLYSVQPPAYIWSISDTDISGPSVYDLGVGTGTGAWVEMTNLVVETGAGQDLVIGDQIRFEALIFAQNPGNQGGDLDFAFGPPGTPPTEVEDTVYLARGAASQIPVGFTEVLTENYPQPQQLTVYVRRSGGEGGNYAPELDGSVTAHNLVLSALSAAAGGGGDVVRGSPGDIGEIAAWQDWDGKVLHGTGVAIADVARRNAVNAFTARQELRDGSVLQFHQSGDTRVGQIQGAATQLNIWGTTDGVASDIPVVVLGSEFRSAVPAQLDDTLNVDGVISENSVPVVYPTDRDETGAAVTLSLDGSPRVVCTHTGVITFTAPASGDGSLEVMIMEATASADLTSFGANVRGSDPGGPAPRVAYVTRAANVPIWIWGQ